MKSTETLPRGYAEIMKMDLQKDLKTAILINVMALVIMAGTIGIAVIFVPFSSVLEGATPVLLLKLAAALLGQLLYLVGHEAVHAVFMRLYCGAKVRFGLTGAYAYAGSDGYYSRRDYRIIAMAPAVCWGIALGVLSAAVPTGWFYVVWLIQAANLGGAAGDYYVTWKVSRMAPDILVQDSGVAMTVFGRTQEEH